MSTTVTFLRAYDDPNNRFSNYVANATRRINELKSSRKIATVIARNVHDITKLSNNQAVRDIAMYIHRSRHRKAEGMEIDPITPVDSLDEVAKKLAVMRQQMWDHGRTAVRLDGETMNNTPYIREYISDYLYDMENRIMTEEVYTHLQTSSMNELYEEFNQRVEDREPKTA